MGRDAPSLPNAKSTVQHTSEEAVTHHQIILLLSDSSESESETEVSNGNAHVPRALLLQRGDHSGSGHGPAGHIVFVLREVCTHEIICTPYLNHVYTPFESCVHPL